MTTAVSIGDFLGRGPVARAGDGTRRRTSAAVLARFVLALLALLFAQTASMPAGAQPAELRALRFGEQGRFTRIVLELDRPITWRSTLERTPPRLLVELPELLWRPRAEPLGRPRGLARGFVREPAAQGGSRLLIELTGPAELVARFAIPPGPDNPGWRLVIDLEPEGASRPFAPTPGSTAAAPAPPSAAGAAPPRPGAIEALPPLPRPRPDTLAAAVAIARAGQPALAAPATPPPLLSPPGSAGAATPPPLVAAPSPSREPAAAAVNGQVGTPDPRPVIVLDPGHGGTDPGTIGVDGLKEKDIVLAIALELEQALLATGRYRVVLTRRADEGLALRERIRIARDAGAALFLSLHADSIADPQVQGASVYTLSETASDAEAAALAAKENKADILSGTDLTHHDPIVASILIDLAQRDTLNKSIELASALSEELKKVTTLLRNHRRFGGFAVLKSVEVPSALIELGYLSNPEEAKRLADGRHRKRLAGAIVAAVDRHLGNVR